MSTRCARPGCKAYAIRGGTICNKHGGSAPQVRNRARVRAEVSRWTLGTPVDDPGETLLRLITQSRERVSMYADEVERLIDEDPARNLTDVLVGESKVWTGERMETVGEYVRAIVQLEAAERDRCAKFCKLAIEAGLAERMVRLAERQAARVAADLGAALDDAGVDETLKRAVLANVGRRLRSIAS